jgi:hypothetical protein
VKPAGIPGIKGDNIRKKKILLLDVECIYDP